MHPDEKKAIADKAGNDKAEQDKLTKAACLAVKCWAEYPAGSDAYNANYVSQLEATQLGPEIEWVRDGKALMLRDHMKYLTLIHSILLLLLFLYRTIAQRGATR